MKKCCICGREITLDNPPILLPYGAEVSSHLCNECEKCIEVLETDSGISVKRKAKNYLSTYFKNIKSTEVLNQLQSIIEESLPQETKTYSENYQSGSSAHNQRVSHSTIWISGLRILAWLMFIAIIITGIALGVIIGGDGDAGIGFLIFLASVIVAFLSVAGMMIYLDIASNIIIITKKLNNISCKK